MQEMIGQEKKHEATRSEQDLGGREGTKTRGLALRREKKNRKSLTRTSIHEYVAGSDIHVAENVNMRSQGPQ